MNMVRALVNSPAVYVKVCVGLIAAIGGAPFPKSKQTENNCTTPNNKEQDNEIRQWSSRFGFQPFILKDVFTFRAFVMAINIGNLNVGFAQRALDINHMRFSSR